jgi:hypothetical protein
MDDEVPLGLLFLAVQFSDIMGALLVFFGVEKVIIFQGMGEVDPMDLAYYPFSHSLAATVLWSVAAYVIITLLPLNKAINKTKFALVIGGCIISHFVIDFVTHYKDMPLIGKNSPMIGLGLDNHLAVSYILETTAFLAGLWLYMGMASHKPAAKRGMLVFAGFLIIINTLNLFVHHPDNVKILVGIGLLFSLVFSGIAFWLDSAEGSPR